MCGARDALRQGRPEEALCRLLLLVLDQAAIDQGSWSRISQLFIDSLENPHSRLLRAPVGRAHGEQVEGARRLYGGQEKVGSRNLRWWSSMDLRPIKLPRRVNPAQGGSAEAGERGRCRLAPRPQHQPIPYTGSRDPSFTCHVLQQV